MAKRNQKNTWLYVGGAALLVWWIMGRRKKALSSKTVMITDAVTSAKAEARGVTFVPDMTTEAQLYADEQKYCK